VISFKIFSFSIKIIRSLFSHYYLSIMLKQLIDLGLLSISLVAFTSAFMGAALTIQIYSVIVIVELLPEMVMKSVTRELGPILIGLIMSGRIGSRIASEIGIIKSHDQIDALITMHTNPFGYLILPRVLATLISMPVLTIIANTIGIYASYVAATAMNYDPNLYLYGSVRAVSISDVLVGILKSSIFGLIISLSASYSGFYSTKSAEGIGSATTRGIVNAAILIIISNYFITLMIPK